MWSDVVCVVKLLDYHSYKTTRLPLAGGGGARTCLPTVAHFANLAMVSVLGLLLKSFPLFQHL